MHFRKFILFIFLTSIISSCALFRHSKKTPKSNSTEVSSRTNINLILKTANSYYGTPYKLGGMDKHGIDCSALVKLSFEKAGISLPRRSIDQSNAGTEVSLLKAQKGDLIFFRFEKHSSNSIDHVGIISNVNDRDAIKFIHASTKQGVVEDDLSKPYNKKAFIKCMRVINN